MLKSVGNYPLKQSPFFRLKARRKLAVLLRVSLQELNSFRHADHLYTETDIPKKSGGARRIENPRRQLKLVQAHVARLLGRISPPEYLFCPVKGRSYVSNARRHAGHRIVRTLDIKKYFPSTTRNRVYLFFRNTMQCSSDVAKLLTDIATYRGHLPTGSPLSPIMAFYAHYEVWEMVHELVMASGAKDSLYIDDLTISGNRVPDKLMWEIRKTIYGAGLEYHKEKLFRDRAAEITGVIIKEGKLFAPNRQLLKRYRAERALAKAANDREAAALKQQIRGLVGQIRQITSALRV